jgi:hypothetical protein
MEDDTRRRRTDEVLPKRGSAARHQRREVSFQIWEEAIRWLEAQESKIGTLIREGEGARAQVRTDIYHQPARRQL